MKRLLPERKHFSAALAAAYQVASNRRGTAIVIKRRKIVVFSECKTTSFHFVLCIHKIRSDHVGDFAPKHKVATQDGCVDDEESVTARKPKDRIIHSIPDNDMIYWTSMMAKTTSYSQPLNNEPYKLFKG